MTRTLALGLLVVGWCVAAPARAQAPAAGDETAANALVEQAARAYDQNQLDEALRLLSRAYELSPRPSILYNQAQVLRGKDDCAGALDAYRRFLEAAPPDDANRDRATRHRDEMQACADQRKPPPAPAPPRLEIKEPVVPARPAGVVVSAPAAPAQPREQSPSHRRAMRAGAWTALGVGVLAAGVAAAFAWQAHGIENQLESEQLLWSDVQSRVSEGQRDATAARLCAGLAALAGGGSVALFWLSRGPADDSGPPAAQPRAGLAGFSGTF